MKKQPSKPRGPDPLAIPTDAGAEVTSISPDPRRPGQLVVRVGRKRAACCDAELLDHLPLATGAPWTDELAQSLADAQQCSNARTLARAILSRRPLARRALIERLRRRGHDAAHAEDAADYAVRIGLLDERAAAEAILHRTLHAKPAGRVLLESRLRQGGVDPDTAGSAVRDALASRDPVEDAVAIATKRLRAMRTLAPEVAKRRLYGVLARRGFEADVCHAAITRVLQDDADGAYP